MMGLITAAALATGTLTAPGPNGPLEGTYVDAGRNSPIVLIIPGSGPTDRDGNNPMGVKAAPYRLLAEALAAKGVSSVRIDKRGLFGSKAATPDPNKVTIADYAADTHSWVASIRKATGAKCVWVVGHSEGALIALAAGQKPRGFCGIITVSGAGRTLGSVMREQFQANPANAPILAPAIATIAALEAGRTVDTTTLPAPLQPVFNAAVQPYYIDNFKQDPAKYAALLTVPLLIVQGDKDIQVAVKDAQLLAAAQPRARLVVVPNVNHVLKSFTGNDRIANFATYADPSLPVAPAVVEAIAGFVKAKR